MFFIRSKHFIIVFILFFIFLLRIVKKIKLLKATEFSYLENRDKLLKINDTNTNDVIKILGRLTQYLCRDKNTWLYIERTEQEEG